MPFSIEVWFLSLPWWGWAFALVAITVLSIVLFFAIESWQVRRETEKWRERHLGRSEIIYPYYVENDGLRDLANSLKLDLPTGRQVTKSRRLSLGSKGTSGQSSQSETQQFGGRIPLVKLADAAEESWGYETGGPASSVTNAAFVSDERVLSAAIEQIEGDFDATSQTAELLSRVKEVFGVERIEALATKKREEYEGIAKRNQMMVFRGQLAFKEPGALGCGPTLKLTHFNPTPGYLSPRSVGGNDETKADLIPVPEGVALSVTMPDEKALLPAGRERIHRHDPFYAGVIAHSPSYDPASGTLTCSAWAIWGEKTPNWQERVEYFPFSGPGATPYAC